MLLRVSAERSDRLLELARLERRAFAARMRAARAILGWSQVELASRIGLTQRAVHKLEQGNTEPRRSTIRIVEETWLTQGLEFEDTGDGGFRVTVRAELLGETGPRQINRRSAGGSDSGHWPVQTNRGQRRAIAKAAARLYSVADRIFGHLDDSAHLQAGENRHAVRHRQDQGLGAGLRA
jgi:transcriptional regulator with XRE-family HTH domain